MVEAMAAANAMLRLKAREKSLSASIHPSSINAAVSVDTVVERDASPNESDEEVPLINCTHWMLKKHHCQVCFMSAEHE